MFGEKSALNCQDYLKTHCDLWSAQTVVNNCVTRITLLLIMSHILPQKGKTGDFRWDISLHLTRPCVSTSHSGAAIRFHSISYTLSPRADVCISQTLGEALQFVEKGFGSICTLEKKAGAEKIPDLHFCLPLVNTLPTATWVPWPWTFS